MTSLTPRLPGFGGADTSDIFLGNSNEQRQTVARMAGTAFSGIQQLKNYKTMANAQLRAAQKSKQTSGQVTPWGQFAQMAGNLADSLASRGQQQQQAQGDSFGTNYWSGGSRLNSNTITPVAFSQPTAFAGGSFTAPNFWDSSSKLDTNSIVQRSFF